MNTPGVFPLIAVDIGNSRVKCGRFDAPPSADTAGLPQPTDFATIDPAAGSWDELDRLCGNEPAGAFVWWIASVQRQTTALFVDQLRERDASRITLITSQDLPLTIRLPRPDMVGVDRLLGAVAANQLRGAGQGAVIVHVGTAITVNLVSTIGEFLGGAILPGITMSARAMHQFTDLLPLIDMQSLSEPPPAVGDATLAAMTSGLYWGAVGGIKQLIELYTAQIGGDPLILLTGGAAPSVAKLLPGHARYEPHLVPAGIALAAAAAK